jgi:hypothetical protein
MVSYGIFVKQVKIHTGKVLSHESNGKNKVVIGAARVQQNLHHKIPFFHRYLADCAFDKPSTRARSLQNQSKKMSPGLPVWTLALASAIRFLKRAVFAALWNEKLVPAPGSHVIGLVLMACAETIGATQRTRTLPSMSQIESSSHWPVHEFLSRPSFAACAKERKQQHPSFGA